MSKNNLFKINSEADIYDPETDDDSDFYPDSDEGKDFKKTDNDVVTHNSLLGMDEESSEIEDDNLDAPEEPTKDLPEENDFLPQDNQSDKRWQRFKKNREEKRLLTSQIESLAQRNAEMEHLLAQSIDISKDQQITAAQNDLAFAKKKLAAALGDSDPDAVAEATYLISQASNNLQQTQDIREVNRDSLPRPDAFRRRPEQVLYDWIADNPEIDKESEEYDSNVAEPVLIHISKLENKLKRNGQAHLIGSPGYFNSIDTYKDSLMEKKSSPKYFGRVSSRGDSRASSPTKVSYNSSQLAEPYRIAAAAFGMTNKEYMAMFKKLNNKG